MIKFVNASHAYRNLAVSLRDINLHIAKQEFVFVVGPTGGGKSSLLRLIYRDAIPTARCSYSTATSARCA